MLRVLKASATVCKAAGLVVKSSLVGNTEQVIVRELRRTVVNVRVCFVQDDERNEGDEGSGIEDTKAIVLKSARWDMLVACAFRARSVRIRCFFVWFWRY